MRPEEAIRLVGDQYAEWGSDAALRLDAWEHAKGWDVGPRVDPTDLNTMVFGGTRFLVTPDGTIHEGSGSQPPRTRWAHVTPTRTDSPGKQLCGKSKHDTLARAAAMLGVSSESVRERDLPEDGATYFWTDQRGGSALILSRYNATFLFASSAVDPETHLEAFKCGQRSNAASGATGHESL